MIFNKYSIEYILGLIFNKVVSALFNIGVDFLIDPITNAVLKIILHSNIPGEVPWSLVLTDEASDVAVSTDKAGHTNQQIRASFAPKEPDPYKSDGLDGPGNPCDSFDSHAAHESRSQKVSELSTDTFSNMIEPAMPADAFTDILDSYLKSLKMTM
ncbi:hypothetical protein MJO28_013742 [Puccinia striiformis f. sp. tritici]|uniref:Uncharacterized protein n=1 Tax=Puccinia striiformis f. sp. tritici TaxID=168172 RepID=A0ACC0DWI1_9BASI|nr:hypothetical protein MJO28_013742 [Puccinia striiformis f. sp. tritici]